jgi:hypothetical protein
LWPSVVHRRAPTASATAATLAGTAARAAFVIVASLFILAVFKDSHKVFEMGKSGCKPARL